MFDRFETFYISVPCANRTCPAFSVCINDGLNKTSECRCEDDRIFNNVTGKCESGSSVITGITTTISSNKCGQTCRPGSSEFNRLVVQFRILVENNFVVQFRDLPGFVGYRITGFKSVGSGHRLVIRVRWYFTRVTKITVTLTQTISTRITTVITSGAIAEFNKTAALTTEIGSNQYDPCLTKEHFGNCSGKGNFSFCITTILNLFKVFVCNRKIGFNR